MSRSAEIKKRNALLYLPLESVQPEKPAQQPPKDARDESEEVAEKEEPPRNLPGAFPGSEPLAKLGFDVERAEFVNFILAQMWPKIDTEILKPYVDMFQDNIYLLKPPPVISDIEITDFSIGKTAPKITGVKVYPTASGADSVIMDCYLELVPTPSKSGAGDQSKSDNIRISMKASVGHRQVGVITTPIVLDDVGFKAQVRIHLILTSKLPFIKWARVSLLSKPEIKFSARSTMVSAVQDINVMDIPGVSQFIDYVVSETVCAFALTPKVVKLNVAKILLGDDVLHDIQTVGIIKLHAQEARHCPDADVFDESDPYLAVGFSENHKEARARTAVIDNELNPRWNENLYIPITEEDVVAGLPLILQVMDYDQITGHDLLGRIKIPLDVIVDSDGNFHNGWASLVDAKGQEVQGRKGQQTGLRYRMSFHPVRPASVSKPGQSESKATLVSDGNMHRSGILCVQVHGGKDIRKGSTASQEISTYVKVYVNGKKDARTCNRYRNNNPYYDEAFEIFVLDWTKANLRLALKEILPLSKDETLGVVSLRLDQMFANKERMATTGFYDIKDGSGSGKLRLSFMFRSVELNEPRNLCGLDGGCVELKSMKLQGVNSDGSDEHKYYIKGSGALLKPCKFDLADLKNASVSLNTKARYRTSLTLEVRKSRVLKDENVGKAVLWLRDVVDDTDCYVILPLNADVNFDEAVPMEDRPDGSVVIGKSVAGRPELHLVCRFKASKNLDGAMTEDEKED
ncbi:hypothetical protein HK102_013907 [Quaeritorhiza haematococci]|nr:hypothetical protein HK102_013907 [Quaeritorhiza haematococci]